MESPEDEEDEPDPGGVPEDDPLDVYTALTPSSLALITTVVEDEEGDLTFPEPSPQKSNVSPLHAFATIEYVPSRTLELFVPLAYDFPAKVMLQLPGVVPKNTV